MPANHHPWLVQGSLALVTLAIAVASLCFGQYPLSLSAVGHTLVHLPPGEGVIGQIVWSVRLPRVVMALLAGGALGLCGATSMDFPLPVLQRSGGVEIVPAAIVHGFLLSLLVPILIAFFTA